MKRDNYIPYNCRFLPYTPSKDREQYTNRMHDILKQNNSGSRFILPRKTGCGRITGTHGAERRAEGADNVMPQGAEACCVNG